MKTLLHILVMLIGFIHPIYSQKPEEVRMETQPYVVAVFPSSDTLPANLLRMYIHFSKPMRPIGNLEKIQLRDESGDEVAGAIFNNVYELWNHEQTQLTILFDPSRVKTGLRSHKERGRALSSGQKYELVIGELQDIDGNTTKSFTQVFTVADEDLSPPNTDLWVFSMPKAESKAPLIVRFPEALDRLSLLQRLKLTDTEKQPLTGHVKIADNETEWHFYPDENWVANDYILFVHSRLEDPSGNNLNGLFDHKPGTLRNDQEGNIEIIPLKLTK
ncbi:MAG: hypothetical protein AAF789_12090 [Bacteroidota bacterium]